MDNISGPGSIAMKTQLFGLTIAIMGSLGIQCGAHRLWSHRSYKAKWQLRVLLAGLQTLALQNTIYSWCRDHRVHHRYSETDADPHNAKRGFFFAHMRWLMCRKHPDVTRLGKQVDMSDLWADPIVRFQHKYYYPLAVVIWLIIPVSVPVVLWGETWYVAFVGNCFRYIVSLHGTWLVNSLAHLGTHWSYRPYDKHINPADIRTFNYLAMGEGWHNYHHTFPNDYSASEYGWKDNWNIATAFIDMFAWIGWAYDRRRPAEAVVKARIDRTGDSDQKYNGLSGVYIILDSIVGLTVIGCHYY
ncbi:unnamed protein product [Oppiella nova]|uniref:Fatty acid desaturase domain-containing protein n=1 Tax=Oppiella nova TaxID=334625 RepID=A0A7R9QP91_9ACAR|nr:unnamed protein product [Oppiella nova]CAG2169291.1 unnamed protein product [Oppiella nova]